MSRSAPKIDRDAVVRLWLERQGLTPPPATGALTKRGFQDHLERTGGLQVDSVNAVDRAHYLTLWSRFGPYDRKRVDRWVYRHRIAYEYWGHEASVLPISRLPISLRRMRRFPSKRWKEKSWWPRFATSPASKRRVLRRLRAEGPLESADFERGASEFGLEPPPGGTIPLPKEDSRSLKLLWHQGRVAIAARRHFRCLYDLSERVYPEAEPASVAELEDSWLFTGLSGNGIASEAHLHNYLTTPALKAPDRKRILARNLKAGRIREVRVEGVRGACYATPEHLDAMDRVEPATGTRLVCPFDSFLWQRKRAEELLDFVYRIEIYVPAAKREFGYYVMPILHDGRLVGRVDPKLHREQARLEIKEIHLEAGFRRNKAFDRGLASTLESLRAFVNADALSLPKGWRRLPV